jgi:hypothetical protein
MSAPVTAEYSLAERKARHQAVREAALERLSGLRARVEILERRIARLSGLLERDAVLPASPPRGSDAHTWGAHARELEALASRLETAFFETERETASALQETFKAALDALDAAPDLDHILALYLARRAMTRGQAESAAWRRLVARVLARLRLAEDEAVPGHLEALARAVILAESRERAELLADELRLGVQRHRADAQSRQEESETAAAWLAQLPEEVLPEALVAFLTEVAAGLRRLDPQTRADVAAQADAFAAQEAEQTAKTAAQVLEASLKDLGYTVEPIAETLFTQGGRLHFQRSGWAEYQVRLRVDPLEKNVNFNVVRARRSENDVETGEETTTRQRLDFLAEDRWCSEFPRLLQTLEARGIRLDVTRQLEAGALPVQALPPEALPDFADETRQARIEGEIRRNRRPQDP